MKTWNDYKNYVKSIDPEEKNDIEEIETIAEIIGAVIEQRKSMGLSQRELAEQCGMPQSSVARIESGKITPNLGTLLKIFRNLGLSISVEQMH